MAAPHTQWGWGAGHHAKGKQKALTLLSPHTQFPPCFFKKLILLHAGFFLYSLSVQNTLNTLAFMHNPQMTFYDGGMSLSALWVVTLLWMGKASCPGSHKRWVARTVIKARFLLTFSWNGFVSILWLYGKLRILIHHVLLEPHRTDKQHSWKVNQGS